MKEFFSHFFYFIDMVIIIGMIIFFTALLKYEIRIYKYNKHVNKNTYSTKKE